MAEPTQLDMLGVIYGHRQAYSGHEIATARAALALAQKPTERRDAIPSVDDIALGITYAETNVINPVTVALRYGRAQELHATALSTISQIWDLIDAARNRP